MSIQMHVLHFILYTIMFVCKVCNEVFGQEAYQDEEWRDVGTK